MGLGVRLVYCRGYSDYYSSAKGGHDVGRGIEPVPYNGRKLGPWLEKLQPGLAQSLGLSVMTNEARSLSNYNRSLRAFAISARVVMRTTAARLRRQALLTNGASLIAQSLKVALERGVSVWTEAPLEDLIVEDGRVVGVRTVRDGKPVLIGPPVALCSPPEASPTMPRCASSTGAISRTRAGGPCRIRATPARSSRRQCGSVPRST